MMLAPKDPTNYIKMICVESIEFTDRVWGNCSLVEGETYDVLIEHRQNVDGWYLVKFGTGLCPHESKYLKTEAEIRDEKLKQLGIE